MSVQQVYVALFGRPADPAGLAYWNQVTNNGQNLAEMLRVLPTLTEYTVRFAGMDNTQIITTIYQNLFGRAPDAAGLAHFQNALASGAQNIATIAVNILQGAQGEDKADVTNKVAAANLFTASLDTPEEIAAYNGTNAATIAREFLNKVDANAPATQEQVNQAAGQVQSGQGPNQGGGGSGGGGGGTPAPQFEAFTVTHSEGNLFAVVDANTVHKGNLYVGTGNPGTGMMKAVAIGEYANIELALDARRSGNATNIIANQVNGDTATYLVTPGNDVRFAFSAGVQAKAGGPFANDTTALDNYDYRLLIDTDPGEGENFVTFNLVTQDTGSSTTTNVSNSPYEWVGPGGAVIKDDGGNGNITQNIQAFDWYNGNLPNLAAGDVYDVKLQAFHKGTNTQIAETEISIRGADVGKSNAALSTVAQQQNGNLLAGSGNSSSGFAIQGNVAAGIELGLGGVVTKVGPVTGTVVDGIVHYQLDGDTARFAYSVASTDGDALTANKFKLKIDTDKGDGVNFITFNLVERATPTTYANNTGGNSEYVWEQVGGTAKIVDDGGDGGVNGLTGPGKVTQNIQNLGWYDALSDTTVPADGKYTVVLEAYAADGVTLIAQNTVVYDIV